MIKRQSNLPRTWLIDLDGTIVEHNGHLYAGDKLLSGVSEFWTNIPEDDYIIILTARSSQYRESTEYFLGTNGIRFDLLIMDLPTGERVLINDRKPDGTTTATSVNINRNDGLSLLNFF